MIRYRKGTADSIVRRYGANILTEVRITESGYSQLYAGLLSRSAAQTCGGLRIFLVSDYYDLHHAMQIAK